MYKIIAIDLDETLLNDQKHVSTTDVSTISSLDDCKVVIATGRGFVSVQENLKEMGLYDKENEYVISSNGGCITENKNNQILFVKKMAFDDVEFLFKLGLKYNFCIHIYTLETTYTYNIFENERKLLENAKFSTKNLESNDISFLRNQTITKVLFCDEDIEYLKKVRKEINLEDRFSISLSSQRYLEFNEKSINKGFGLKKLCEILNIDISETIGVGDNINDITLIKDAGLGIGVKNVVDEVKPYCDVILDVTNNEDPLTDMFNRYIKRN